MAVSPEMNPQALDSAVAAESVITNPESSYQWVRLPARLKQDLKALIGGGERANLLKPYQKQRYQPTAQTVAVGEMMTQTLDMPVPAPEELTLSPLSGIIRTEAEDVQPVVTVPEVTDWTADIAIPSGDSFGSKKRQQQRQAAQEAARLEAQAQAQAQMMEELIPFGEIRAGEQQQAYLDQVSASEDSNQPEVYRPEIIEVDERGHEIVETQDSETSQTSEPNTPTSETDEITVADSTPPINSGQSTLDAVDRDLANQSSATTETTPPGAPSLTTEIVESPTFQAPTSVLTTSAMTQPETLTETMSPAPVETASEDVETIVVKESAAPAVAPTPESVIDTSPVSQPAATAEMAVAERQTAPATSEQGQMMTESAPINLDERQTLISDEALTRQSMETVIKLEQVLKRYRRLNRKYEQVA